MKIILQLPKFSVLSSLDIIARNVAQTHLRANSLLPEGVVEIERVGDEIRWRQGAEVLVFPAESVLEVSLAPLENAGKRFLAATITWRTGSEPLRYRLITSHESEVDWVRRAADQIADLLGKSVSDL